MSADPIARGLASKARNSVATVAKSSNTAQLVSAIRSNGFFPQPLARAPANDIPVIALGTAGAVSAINARAAGTPLVLASDSRIRWLNGPLSADGSGCWYPRGAWYGAGRNSQYAAIEFVHTGTDLELCFLGSFYGATNNLRVLVNDRIVTMQSLPAATGSYYYLRLTFPASATRRIRIEGASGKFRGINVALDTAIAGTGRAYPLISVMGDSFSEGTGANPVMDGEAVSLVRALGGDIMLGAVGGTGLLAAGSYTTWTNATRITDLTMAGVTDAFGRSTTPALGVVLMTFNDRASPFATWSAFGATYQAAVNNRVWALIDAWTAANPGKPLVVFGPTWPSDAPSLDVHRIRDAAQEACWGAASSNVWFIDRLAPAPILRRGTKAVLTTTGTTTNASAVLTALGSTLNLGQEFGVTGTGIPAGARIMSVDSATQVTLDLPCTASASGVSVTFLNDHAATLTALPADATHPNTAGHNLDALWMARALRNLILTELA